MRDRDRYDRRSEVIQMLDSPAVVTDLPGGGVRFEKAGAIGAGPTHREAVAAWSREFSAMIARPKPPAAGPGADTELPVPFVSPTDVAPPV